MANQGAKRKPTGSIYILQWEDGVIKVGKSHTPHTRVGMHLDERKDVAMQAHWISPSFPGYWEAETHLIQWAKSQAATWNSRPGVRLRLADKPREWFVGLSFEEAVVKGTALYEAGVWLPPMSSPTGTTFVFRRDRISSVQSFHAKLVA